MMFSGRHDSTPVNPLIAGAFHRTGAVEIWGRGTNRVIAACRKHGCTPPTFEERSGFLIVTFRAPLVPKIGEGNRDSTQKSTQKRSQKSAQKILERIANNPGVTIDELAARIGISS